MYFIRRKNIYYVEFKVVNKTKRISTRSKTLKEAKIFADQFFTQDKPEVGKKKKESEPRNELMFSNFKREYISYIESARSSSYLRSVKLSFNHFEKNVRG